MKKLAILSAAVLALLMTGCSDKSPSVDMTEKEQTQSVSADSKAKDAVGSDEVSGEEGMVSGGETLSGSDAQDSAQKLEALEKQANKIYFDFDKYDIRDDQVSRVDAVAKLFKSESDKDYTIKIEGNCDEWGTDEYNYALGLKRGKSVKEALVDRGVSQDKIVIVSYGESNPVCTQSNKECWQKNRRVEFKILP